MKIDQEKSDFLDEMLDHWQDENLLTLTDIEKLKASYETKSFDWRRLAQYSFWVAMACGVISLGALLIDNKFLDYLKNLYDTPKQYHRFNFSYSCGGPIQNKFYPKKDPANAGIQ
ncbi:hypothetical protein [Pedobacter sp. NJ-S-72]